MRRETILLLLCIYPVEGICQGEGREQLHPAVLAITEKIITLSEDDELPEEFSYEEIIDHFSALARKPMNINRAEERELGDLKILTEWEISSIINYRKESGDLFSLAELYLIPGLSQESISLLTPFLTTGVSQFSFKDALPGNARLILRGALVPQKKVGYMPITKEDYEKRPDSRYLGNPLSIYGQLRYNLQDRYSAIVTIEKDAGEKGADFISWSLAAKETGIVDKLVIGSYTARFGQGMVLWNSFYSSSVWEPWQSMKREQGIKEFTSSDENIALKGVAATFNMGSLTATLMISRRRVDARVTEEGYTSLLTTGLHNTKTLLERRGSLGINMAALNIGYFGHKLKLSLSLCKDAGSIPYAGKSSVLINRERHTSSIISNGGFDWRYANGRFIIYGEAAVDCTGSAGVVTGLNCRISENSLLSVRVDKVSKSYIAPFSYNYRSSGSGVTNLFSCIKLRVSKNFSLYVKSDYSKERFRISAMGEVNNQKGFNMVIRSSCSDSNYSFRGDLKLCRGLKFTNHFRADLTGTSQKEKKCGVHIHNELIFKLLSNKLNLSARCAYFNIPDWENRLYSYEKEILYQFRTTLLYGKAFRYYVNINIKPGRNVDIWLRYSTTRYLDRIKTGEGPEEISGPSKSEAKVQVQITL